MYEDFLHLRKFYIGFTVVIFLILIGRLVQLQFWDRDKYFKVSERNRVREVVIDPPRGLMFDRHGDILVDNRPAYFVSVVPYEIQKADTALNLLASIFNQSRDVLNKTINEKKVGRFLPVKIKRQIAFKHLSDLEEHRLDLPGVFWGIESKRFYPEKVKASHLLGYLGELTPQEYSELKSQGYRRGDFIGKNGLELTYENFLRGKPAVNYVEVDVLGREVKNLPELSTSSIVPGKNLVLTIDAPIQKFLEQRMADQKGAVVVLDPRNGEVLALVSKPDYDPGLFSNILSDDIWKELANHKEKPLYNRACQSLYPPGSTFKVILAAAGLEIGMIHLEEKIFCPGYYQLGRRAFGCWKKDGHGSMNLMEAIERSCNVYFYTQMLKVGLDNWSKFAKFFEFGKVTGINLPSESRGLVPDKIYFDVKYGERKWTRGLLLNLAVGQGDLLVTPLQMACLAMILATEGKAYQPHLVNRIADPLTGKSVSINYDSVRIQGVSVETFQKIKQGMYLVVNGTNGTGKAAWMPGIKVCGKTGTAENSHGEAHAWFIGFAPMENPEIAFAILVENGGSGGAVAAPIAKGILTTYFDGQKIASR